jgi:threonine synthase
MRYSSTRWSETDKQEYFSFEQVVLKGLASDGGLFHPDHVPNVRAQMDEWKDLSFSQLAFEIIRIFVDGGEIADDELRTIVNESYATFRSKAVTPLVPLSESANLHLLELFHGPTFAFKDVALQFLGNLFSFFLVRKNRSLAAGTPRHHLTVIGATSGDTGSAAIYGLRGKPDVSIFIMFPHGKVSPVQEQQMTTVPDANVHCLSVTGTFDDCQDYVKALFSDPETNKIHHLAAVNSINWARILAQITYYWSSYFQLIRSQPETRKIRYVVPTGNFGDILAGYYASRLGLPITKLIIATNENDILHRFWSTGTYSKTPKSDSEPHEGIPSDGAQAHEAGVKETLSPAMDILVSSNFERLLWHLTFDHECETNPTVPIQQSALAAGKQIQAWFAQLKTRGEFSVGAEILARARELFSSYRVSNAETLETIRAAYRGDIIERTDGYVLDPHSAIGVHASLAELKQFPLERGEAVVSLATAHPAKFAGAVELALKEETGFDFEKTVTPSEFKGLDGLQKRVTRVEPSVGLDGLRDLITREVEAEKEVRNGA